ncbi:MAG: helix-turn-helix transcriptional regulator [Treponema sp.]|jgi:putative molybdopterin biosynthesis protein|nr:helix-turn-helix transcriptional regulator [Treponema sp.]
MNNIALSTQEVADMLRVSKSTVYDLIRNGEIVSYKVGRKVRFTHEDVMQYIAHAKSLQSPAIPPAEDTTFRGSSATSGEFIICGQDLMLDILSNHLRLHEIPALRAYIGSYDSLVLLYRKKIHVASAHIWDSDSDSYNVPYVRRLLPGIPTVIVQLTYRIQGFYVQKGNPKNIRDWKDFERDDIVMINREKGAGSRVLLDEHLRLLGINANSIQGYDHETQSHLTVASAVSGKKADVAIGTEKMARQVENIDFIPLKKERYDLVFRKEDIHTKGIETMLKIIRSNGFKNEFGHIGGYDISEMGRIVAEI